MPNLDAQITVLLLSCCLGLLLFGLWVLFGIARRLFRVEHLLLRLEATEAAPSVAETSAGGAFEAFLGEDPARRLLTKSEQFAAYRQWRQEKGLNWSASAE